MNVLRSQRNNDGEKKNYVTQGRQRRRRRILAAAPSASFPGEEVVPAQNKRMRFDRWIGALYATFTKPKQRQLHTYTRSLFIHRIVAYVWDFIYTSLWIPATRALYEMSIDTRETSQLSTLGRTALDDFKAEWTHMCVLLYGVSSFCLHSMDTHR